MDDKEENQEKATHHALVSDSGNMGCSHSAHMMVSRRQPILNVERLVIVDWKKSHEWKVTVK